jgi:hypothetical protein
MFVINVVRDPRDVLTSSKRGHEGFYVELTRWRQSVEATEAVLQALQGHPHLLTLRYEDVMRDADRVAALLMERTGLQLRPHVTSWAQLKDNISALGQTVDRASAMHGLRNLDTSSVGRWRHDPEKRRFVAQMLDESPHGEVLRRFMATHNYALEEGAAVEEPRPGAAAMRLRTS